jgi:ubiquinone/menaquinone biosynthesis C-methylase UbiE
MQHWNDYWKEGFLTSFGSSFTGNYQGVYSQHWDAILSDLPRGSQILDLATGNGSIPLLGRKISQAKDLSLHFTGTDLAEVDTALIGKQIGFEKDFFPIDFTILTGIDSAQLPFDDEQFDCVTSQYGFEYGDIKKTIEEVSRVLKPDGTVAFVLHNSHSVILERNNQTLDCLHDLVKSGGLLTMLSEFIKAMGEVQSKYDLAILKGNKKTDKARNKFNDSVAKLESKYDIGFFDSNIGDLITGLFKQYMFYPRVEKYKLINKFKVSALSHMERLADLKNAASDQGDIANLIKLSTEMKFKCVNNSELIDQEKGLLGWTLTMKSLK